MPVFSQGESHAPDWSEIEAFFMLRADNGPRAVKFRGPKERYFVTYGEVTFNCGGDELRLTKGEIFDPPTGADVTYRSDTGGGLCRIRGHWGDELGGSGLFGVTVAAEPVNPGTPTDYYRNTAFDNHYHDCDEYWIIFSGSGVAYSEGAPYTVAAGDCVATKAGIHHDFPVCNEEVGAVFFEATMKGKKRHGHLWAQTHGEPGPELTEAL